MFATIKTAWKRFICKHNVLRFKRNIYGDEINQVSLSRVYRSWWGCESCGRWVPKEMLVPENLHDLTVQWLKGSASKDYFETSARPERSEDVRGSEH